MSENNPFEQFEEAEQRPFNREHFVRMLGYLRSYKRAGFLTGVGILLAAGVPLFEPYLLGKIVDDGIVPGNVEAVRNIAIMMAVLQLFAWIGRRTTNLMAAVIGQGTLFDLREDLFTHIQKLSLRFYDKHPVGRIMSRITSDVESIARLLNTGLVTFVGEGVTLIGIGSTILNGAKIGKNCIIGAHALIPEGKEIPDNSLVMGAPGKVVKEVSPHQIQVIKMSALHYVENWKRHRASLKRID